jgi:hypothetical protein
VATAAKLSIEMGKATLWISVVAVAFACSCSCAALYAIATTDSAARREPACHAYEPCLASSMLASLARRLRLRQIGVNTQRNQNIGVKSIKSYCGFAFVSQCNLG